MWGKITLDDKDLCLFYCFSLSEIWNLSAVIILSLIVFSCCDVCISSLLAVTVFIGLYALLGVSLICYMGDITGRKHVEETMRGIVSQVRCDAEVLWVTFSSELAKNLNQVYCKVVQSELKSDEAHMVGDVLWKFQEYATRQTNKEWMNSYEINRFSSEI